MKHLINLFSSSDPLGLVRPAETRDFWSLNQSPIVCVIDLQDKTVDVDLRDLLPDSLWALQQRGAVLLAALPDQVDASRLGAFLKANLSALSAAVSCFDYDWDAEDQRFYRVSDPQRSSEIVLQQIVDILKHAPEHELPGFAYTHDYLGGENVLAVRGKSVEELGELAKVIEAEARAEGYILWDDPIEYLQELREQQEASKSRNLNSAV